MSYELRKIMLSKVISSEGVFHHKYSIALNTMKAIIELEQKEKENKLPSEYFKRFSDIEKNSSHINTLFKGIPLLLLEQYFLRNSKTLDKYLNISYKNIDIETFQVYDLYLALEQYFLKLFMLAVEIADFYSIEIKIKNTNSSEDNIF